MSHPLFTCLLLTDFINFMLIIRWTGNATFAGGAAAVAANVVLVAYLIVAWKDDKEEREHMTAGQIKKTE